MVVYPSEIERHLGEVLTQNGFAFDEVKDCIDYGERPAGAVFHTAFDCKLQICWSSREKSFDYMLSRIDAPNELGLSNRSKKWHFLLMLDDSEDDLVTPSIHADAEVWWSGEGRYLKPTSTLRGKLFASVRRSRHLEHLLEFASTPSFGFVSQSSCDSLFGYPDFEVRSTRAISQIGMSSGVSAGRGMQPMSRRPTRAGPTER